MTRHEGIRPILPTGHERSRSGYSIIRVLLPIGFAAFPHPRKVTILVDQNTAPPAYDSAGFGQAVSLGIEQVPTNPTMGQTGGVFDELRYSL